MKHATIGDTKSNQSILPRRFSTVCSGSACAFIFACSCSQVLAVEPYEHKELEDALRCSELGDFVQSARILRNLHKHHPNDVFILTKLGDAYMNNIQDLSESTKLAEQCFKRAIEIDPQYGEPYAKLAECAGARGDFDLGIKLSTKAMTVKEPDFSALKERAAAYSHLKRDKEALADIDHYLTFKPKNTRKLLLLKASILENLKRYGEALIQYRAFLKEHYEDQLVYREVACLEGMNKPDEALKTLDHLILHNKEDDAAYLTRARLNEKQGRHKQAIADYTASFDLQPSTKVLKERAAVYDNMGRKDLAEKDRREAERL